MLKKEQGRKVLHDHSVEVSIVPFKYKHLPLLLEMLNSQNYLDINKITMKSLPKIGYIALIDKQPISAGFLRRVEGGYAQIDGLTSNAFFGSKIRHEGIKLVVDELIKDAKSLKLYGILAFTADKGILSRAADLGFQTVEQTLIALRL